MEDTNTKTTTALADVGMIGLGVMGRNLSLNFADHGYAVAGFDLSPESIARFVREFEEDRTTHNRDAERRATPTPRDATSSQATVIGCESIRDLVARTRLPRVIIILVPAGKPVDAVCDSLIAAGIESEDIVVDCGNSMWTDTIAREERFRGRLTFFGSGVSGGEVGARFGPSLMPGGDPRAWERLRPMWEAIAAKIDPDTGRPIETAAPGRPVTGGEPCTAYIGPNGAGHYVKMVHNGIEYADMQLICEAYHLLRGLLGLEPRAIADIFAEWNEGELDSYLIEITADILRQDDPVTGGPFVDVVLDAAGQKGTGRWTAINALNLGVPAMTIAEAVFARSMSALKDERSRAAALLPSPAGRGVGGEGSCDSPSPSGRGVRGEGSSDAGDRDQFIDDIHAALYCSKICAYAQGFQLMHAAQREYDWELDFGEIARIWRGGCIIRARFLQRITDAFARDGTLANLLLDPHFQSEIAGRQGAWREVVMRAVSRGVPTPAFGSSLAYFDSYRHETLPANLLQAQRDYFGGHGYERVDQPRGRKFHLDWPEPGRPQLEQ